jgi:arylsulfatase A-like enzyme
MGYADIGCFGAKGYKTPNIDKMAVEGMRFTDFYVAAPYCTPSRAALMTGCYPQRVGLAQNCWPTGPRAEIGINSSEEIMPEILKTKGYKTACFGKWHLGHKPKFLPTRHGFDEYFGLPYSNDMWPKHPTIKDFPDLPLMEGEKILEYNPDQTKLTTWYTERALKFIEKNKNNPFFIYLPHSMPHVPIFVSDKFKGKAKRGLYGDVIMEIDWSVGQILSKLKKLGIDENTLVIFTSDNGPWLSYGEHAGIADPLREGKGTTFDGGQRVPCVMRWPGKIPAGKDCRQLATSMDLLPTFAYLTGGEKPKNKIDGKNIWPLMAGEPNAKSPHEAFFYYFSWNLRAVRSGKWKLNVPHGYHTVIKGGKGGLPGRQKDQKIGLALFNLEKDIEEKHNVAEQYPKVVERLLKLLDKMREELGDAEKKMTGKNRRPVGHI